MNIIIARVFAAVTDVTEITEDEIKSKSKREDIVLARQQVVYFLKQYDIPNSTIAKEIGITTAGVRTLFQAAENDTRKISEIFLEQ